jgi:hypothetical protein
MALLMAFPELSWAIVAPQHMVWVRALSATQVTVTHAPSLKALDCIEGYMMNQTPESCPKTRQGHLCSEGTGGGETEVSHPE